MSYPYEKFYDLIDELQKVKDDGINFPGWIFVKSKDLEEVIEAMFDMTKAAFNNAETIVKREREILQDAKSKAERIIQDAENDRNRILSESNILREIEEKAQKYRQEVLDECADIKMNAFHEAEDKRLEASEAAAKIKDGAQQYAQNVLGKLQNDLNQLYQIVMNGQQYIADMKANDEYSNEQNAQ